MPRTNFGLPAVLLDSARPLNLDHQEKIPAKIQAYIPFIAANDTQIVGDAGKLESGCVLQDDVAGDFVTIIHRSWMESTAD